MSVLQRKLFNRGGNVARGTGITSGLLPVQKFNIGGKVTGTGALLDFNNQETGPIPAGKILDGGSLVDNQTYTTQVPTLEELTEKNRGVVESIYGPRPDRLSKSEILAPYILD